MDVTLTRTEPTKHFKAGMPGYVLRDWEILDYECHQLPSSELWFRGPLQGRLLPKKYFSAIGAAQTFGCFCETPYPVSLGRLLGLPGLNLGYSGAGPRFYLRHPELIETINNGRFCVVQVMSGRSTSNSGFSNPEGLGHGTRIPDGLPLSAESLFSEIIERELARIPILPRRAKSLLLKMTGIPLRRVQKLVDESRQDWIDGYCDLLAAITVPKVLLWFSMRDPDYELRYHRPGALLGKYPHLIDEATLAQIKPLANAYVQCTSRRGSPQPLVSRFTGKPATVSLETDLKPTSNAGKSAALYQGKWHVNSYYPSPEMQDDAANALEPACKPFLG